MANRFTTFQPQRYTQTFVPTPFDFIQGNLESRQKAFDVQEQQRIDLLGQQLNPLQKESDINAAKQAKKEVDTLLESYASQDLTDPSIKSKFQKDVRTVKNRFGPMGDIGAIHSRREAAAKQMAAIDEFAEKNKIPGHIARYQKEQFLNNIPDFGVDESTGIYRGVGTPQLEQYIDPNEQIGKYVKEIAYQQMASIDPRARQVEGDPYSYYTSEGKIQTLPRQQILDAAYAKYQADIPLQKSIQQEAAALSGGNKKFASQLAGNPFQVDEEGRVKRDKRGEPLINPNSLLGAAFEGVARERSFRREDINMDINADFASRKAAEDEIIPSYEQPGVREVTFGTPINFNRIKSPSKTGLITGAGSGEGAASAAEALMGIDKPKKPQEKVVPFYEQLEVKEKPIFDNLAKKMFPNSSEEELKSNEVFNQVESYMKSAAQGLSSTPYSTSRYKGDKGEKRQKDDTNDLIRNSKNRIFYNLKTGEAIEGNSDKIQEKLNAKDAQVEIVGDYSPENVFGLLSGKEGLGNAKAVTIDGEEYAVSKAKSEIDQNPVDRVINKTYETLITQPYLPQDVKLAGDDYKVIANPQPSGEIVYIVSDKEGNEKQIRSWEGFVRHVYSE